jgi:hypothetical protein
VKLNTRIRVIIIEQINDNIKPVKIIVDIIGSELLELSIDKLFKLTENEINKDIFKIFKS